MAYGAEPAGGHDPSHTIYVWPSKELIARSWHWPAFWHEAFQHAAGRIGLAVAMCVLEGYAPASRQAVLRLSMGTLRISVRRRGASTFVRVHEFTGPETPGPDNPGPDGGARQQPSSADGLVLGLRGAGRSSYLVVFHGYMPPIPTENSLPWIPAAHIRTSVGGSSAVRRRAVSGGPSEASPVFRGPRRPDAMAETAAEGNSSTHGGCKPGHKKLRPLQREITASDWESAAYLNGKVQYCERMWLPPALFNGARCRYLH